MAMQFNFQTAALRVCVDSTEGGSFQGRIVGQRISSAIHFTDINSFIVQVDTLLDVQRFPQAFQRIRSFTDKDLPDVPAVQSREELQATEDVNSESGEIATFMLHIYTRKNACWQGHIDWLDGSGRKTFNSSLEFFKLVDDKLKIS
ncbi:MAG: hypothetical protein IJY96_03165 [Oscillospiraceae bacterium]|nr:hypothetical protein [Oscillospiraceae bacterium]